jgi:glycosyltransferase involved in cell wall biosynthesis
MAVYNAEAYVAGAIASIRRQTHTEWEMILIDDGSTDASASIAEEIQAVEPRLRVIRRPHAGRSAAINAGVELARGELIARMDADDIALPERLALQIDWMQRSRLDVCGGWTVRLGERGGFGWFPPEHADIERQMVFDIGLMFPTVIFAADVLRENKLEVGLSFEDYELYTRLLGRYRHGNVPAVVLSRRNHPQQGTHLERDAWPREARTYRPRVVERLFPDATAEDLRILDQIAGRTPFQTLAELEHAGDWLLRLSESPDRQLRRVMLRRWRQSCRASAKLGPGAFRTFRSLARRFEVPLPPGEQRLRAACLLRAAPRPGFALSAT